MFQALLLSLAFAALPPAEVETIVGDRLVGELVELNDESLVLKVGTESRTIKSSLVLEIRQPVPVVPLPPGPRVELLDGSRLSCKEVTVGRDRARLTLHSGAETQLPTNRVASIRLGESSPALDDAWNALKDRESKNDLLVVRKDDVLDFLPGVAGEFGEKITFLVDGEELPVSRDRVYGVVYRKRNIAAAKVTCQLRLATGDSLQALGATLADGEYKIRLAGNVELKIPADQVAGLDFSAGKVRYLSQMEPRDKKLVPLFDLPRDVERDRSVLGSPLTLGGKVYSRGLGIFPQTRLKYRIAGEFARFRAVTGIDDAAPRLKTSVHLTISGDGKPLYDAEIAPADAPRTIDLDVTGVRELDLLVDF
ncbi:MAG: NPCBM/NEW2 domain-containing protein, partial [Planctomycetota bacterium]|nr:NPCBM/NEW2 domain-containing protein [Planctomycetota bacterium]